MPTTEPSKNNKIFLSTKEIYEGQVSLAFVIDGEVVQTFLCDERLAAVLQSDPVIVELENDGDPFFNGPHVGWKYDGKNFYNPYNLIN
jgi:hypothetical protein